MYLKLTHLVQCSPKSERGGKLAFLANIKQKMPKLGSLPNPVGRWLEPVTCVMSDKQVLIPLLNFKSKGHFTYNQSLKMEFSFFFLEWICRCSSVFWRHMYPSAVCQIYFERWFMNVYSLAVIHCSRSWGSCVWIRSREYERLSLAYYGICLIPDMCSIITRLWPCSWTAVGCVLCCRVGISSQIMPMDSLIYIEHKNRSQDADFCCMEGWGISCVCIPGF